MAKVGRFVIDPRAGAYCQVRLDDGTKLIVNHDKGGFKGGRLTIEVSKLFGLSSEQIFVCDLDSGKSRAVLERLTADVPKGSAAATPLSVFVNYIKEARSLDEAKTRCRTLFD
jgi:hypothetical protein